MLTTMQQEPKRVETIVLAACVLHNLLITRYPIQATKDVDKEDAVTHTLIPGAWREDDTLVGLDRLPGNTSLKVAKRHRNYLCKYYSSEAGRVAWQDKMI